MVPTLKPGLERSGPILFLAAMANEDGSHACLQELDRNDSNEFGVG